MTKLAAMPIYGKNPLKILFSGTKGPMTLRLGMQLPGRRPNKVCSNDDLGLTMTFFIARSNLFPSTFIWENIYFFRKMLGRHLVEETYNKSKFCPQGLVCPCPGAIRKNNLTRPSILLSAG